MAACEHQISDIVNQNIDGDLTSGLRHIRAMAGKTVNKPLGTRVKAAREAVGLTQSQLAERIGLKQTAVAEIEGGRVRHPKKLYEISLATGKSVEWLQGDEAEHIDSMQVAANQEHVDPDNPSTIGSATGRRGIPDDTLAQIDVTGGMGGGGLTLVADGVPGKNGMTFAAEHVRDYWRLPPTLLAGMGLRPHDTIVLPVQGDSMLPTLNEGDFVFVDTRHRLPSPDGLYALTDEFGGIVVKRLEVLGRRDDEVFIHVISDNERHPARERMLSEIQIIGRVVRRFGVIG